MTKRKQVRVSIERLNTAKSIFQSQISDGKIELTDAQVIDCALDMVAGKNITIEQKNDKIIIQNE